MVNFKSEKEETLELICSLKINAYQIDVFEAEQIHKKIVAEFLSEEYSTFFWDLEYKIPNNWLNFKQPIDVIPFLSETLTDQNVILFFEYKFEPAMFYFQKASDLVLLLNKSEFFRDFYIIESNFNFMVYRFEHNILGSFGIEARKWLKDLSERMGLRMNGNQLAYDFPV